MKEDKKPSEAKSSAKGSKTSGGEDEFRHYYNVMKSQGLTELEIRDKDFYLRYSREQEQPIPPPVSAATPPAPPPPKAEDTSRLHPISSPLAGIFYRAPSPQADPFVREGDRVHVGQVLCIIEAMKVMNEIRADRPSLIKKILVENGHPVAAGQDVFLVEP